MQAAHRLWQLRGLWDLMLVGWRARLCSDVLCTKGWLVVVWCELAWQRQREHQHVQSFLASTLRGFGVCACVCLDNITSALGVAGIVVETYVVLVHASCMACCWSL
jgi:hypothetical protein